MDLLCQKLADQALHFKDLVKEAIEPGVGMAKPGTEFSDELTPTSENESSDYSSSTDQGHDSDSTQGTSESQEDAFRIMQLPVEVNSTLFNLLNVNPTRNILTFYLSYLDTSQNSEHDKSTTGSKSTPCV